MMRKIFFLAVVLALAAAPAFADNKKQAAIHLKQGAAYYKAEQYDAAIGEFQKAYELEKKPQTLFNIANAYYKKGDLEKAIEFFQLYLSADPDGKFAPQALEFSAIAKKELAEREAKAKAEKAAAEAEQKRMAIAGRVKEAEAYEQAGSWTAAGDVYRELAESSGEAEYLLRAAAAYRKQPALDKSRDAYKAYLDKVPMGPKSDDARTQLAAITAELDRQTQAPASSVVTTPNAPAASVVASAAERKHAAKVFVSASFFLLPGPGPFNKGLALGDTAVALEASIKYAFSDRVFLAGTFSHLPNLDVRNDADPQVHSGGKGSRAGAGVGYLTRRGKTIRPLAALHVSYRSIKIENSALGSDSNSGFGPEVELGLLFEVTRTLDAAIATRVDFGFAVSSAIPLMMSGASVGAHF